MKSFAVIFSLLTMIPFAHGDEIHVIDSRRNIPLSDSDPVYKDYYLNAGEGSGLKKNLVVTVVRKVTVRDASGSQTIGEIDIPVAQLRILAVFGKVSVARDYKPLSRDDYPMLEQIGVMGGDRIELKGSFVDGRKPKADVADSEKEETREAASTQAPSATPPPTAKADPNLTPVAAPEADKHALGPEVASAADHAAPAPSHHE